MAQPSSFPTLRAPLIIDSSRPVAATVEFEDLGRISRERDLYREQATIFAAALIERDGEDVVSAVLAQQGDL